MTVLEKKRVLLIEQEKKFARTLSRRVLEKPPLSVWMILIPIIFVYWFMRLNKVTQGQNEFVLNYMLTRELAIQEAFRAVCEKKTPDCRSIAMQAKIAAQAIPPYEELLTRLTGDYISLLQQDGNDFPAMVRRAYPAKSAWLLLQNALNQAEKKLHTALTDSSDANLDETINKIEAHTGMLRRELADEIYDGPSLKHAATGPGTAPSTWS